MTLHALPSINHLAREIGISEATLHRVMNGERRPGQKVISNMLTYFDAPFEQVFLHAESLTKVNETA